jgi:hypothetical protein
MFRLEGNPMKKLALIVLAAASFAAVATTVATPETKCVVLCRHTPK